jgi:hypothetical protein
VYQNGIKLGDADYTSTSGTSIVLAQGASVDDLVVVVVFDVFSVSDTVSKADGGTFDGNVTMSNNLTVSGAFTSQGIDDNADATAITIDSSENVGIGTSSPSTTLTVVDDVSIEGSTPTLSLADTDVSNNKVELSYDEFLTIDLDPNNARGNSGLIVKSDGNERMRIDSNGKLFVGSTTNTTARIVSVADLSAMHALTLQNSASNTGNIFTRHQNNIGQDCGNIVQSGSTTLSYGTSSDYRLKENVTYDFDATTRLKKLKPCRFNFIADGTDKVVDGFLAHEVANDADDNAIVPEAIVGQKDAVDDDGNPILQQIDHSKLVPLLVKTIQELEARITALENT